MGKGGIILGLIGLLLGASGLGLGVINFMNQPSVYYSYRDTDYMPSPALQYLSIPNLSQRATSPTCPSSNPASLKAQARTKVSRQ